MLHIKNFNYKFYNKEHIYTITKPNLKLPKKQYLSVPYYGKEITNVITGFDNYDLCSCYLRDNYVIEKINLDEFKYIGSIINLPVVIILNISSNNVFEIYYSHKRYKDLLSKNFYVNLL
jgi:hypothetical protein